MTTSRLLFPAIRWNRETHSYDDFRPTIDRGRELGVGGYIIFGGPAEAVAELTAELRAGSRHPLLIGADLERGAGQQFHGATALPPPAAIAALGDVELSRRAGELTAREALGMGINWIYAPVADLDLEPENPIVGSRAFGHDPDVASQHVVAWIEGCRAAGALACAKHFPGHGRTTSDSHLQLPRVEADAEALETDLVPFRRAIAAGVDSLMTAHVAYPALDGTGAPATLSRPILTGLLRERLGFEGLVVTDALIMEGVLEKGAGEAEAAVRAMNAGCDALLYPNALDAVAEALVRERGGTLEEGRVTEALTRIERAATRVAGVTQLRTASSEGGTTWGEASDRAWALELARRCIHPLRGDPSAGRSIQLLTVDDDIGGPFAPGPRDTFPARLRARGLSVDEVSRPDGELPLVIALYADIKGFKGRPGLSEAGRDALEAALAVAPHSTIVLFGHPRLAAQVPGRRLLGAWGGEALMQEAAALYLAEAAR
jgi:beta-glucosidase-like glycosyl hydrolase